MGGRTNNYSGEINISSTDLGDGFSYDESFEPSIDFGVGLGFGGGYEISYNPDLWGFTVSAAAYDIGAVRGSASLGLLGFAASGDLGVGAIFGAGKPNIEAFAGGTAQVTVNWWTGEVDISVQAIVETSQSLGFGTANQAISHPLSLVSSYGVQQATEDDVRAAHPYIPDAIMDEIISQEADRVASDPYSTPYGSTVPHGYFGNPALQRALDILDRKYQAAQAYVDGLDRAAAEANSQIGGDSGGSGGNNGGIGGGIHDPDGNGEGAVATSAGNLSSTAGITTGTFTPPGTWSGGSQTNGAPDPGLSVNPDYTGIQPVILDLDGDGVEIAVNAQIGFDWDGDGFAESGAWAAADNGFLVVDPEAANLFAAPSGLAA